MMKLLLFLIPFISFAQVPPDNTLPGNPDEFWTPVIEFTDRPAVRNDLLFGSSIVYDFAVDKLYDDIALLFTPAAQFRNRQEIKDIYDIIWNGTGGRDNQWELDGTFTDTCPLSGLWRRDGATPGATTFINMNILNHHHGEDVRVILQSARENDRITFTDTPATSETYSLGAASTINGNCIRFGVTLFDSVGAITAGQVNPFHISYVAPSAAGTGITYQTEQGPESNAQPTLNCAGIVGVTYSGDGIQLIPLIGGANGFLNVAGWRHLTTTSAVGTCQTLGFEILSRNVTADTGGSANPIGCRGTYNFGEFTVTLVNNANNGAACKVAWQFPATNVKYQVQEMP